MIDSLLLVDDEVLFHLVFEDACSLLDIAFSVQCVNGSDQAIELFKKWLSNPIGRPECVLVDFHMPNSPIDGIELIRKINFELGNSVVIGVISSNNESEDQARAIQAGAQFWMVKSDDIEPRLKEFKKDYPLHKKKKLPFKVYE
jgi:CheY-like chemotaxis protein